MMNGVLRGIVMRHRGERHGPITSLVRPTDIGRLIKPFIFLDYLDVEMTAPFGFGFHPHSGIATLTHHLTGDVAYEDTSGQRGIVRAGGIEWMAAGKGVWHRGTVTNARHATGFQLWLALPRGAEDALSAGLYISPEHVEHADGVRVLLGQYGTARSRITSSDAAVNYFYVDLVAGREWRFAPPAAHRVAWIFVHRGSVVTAEATLSDELAVYDDSPAPLIVRAISDAGFLIGTAIRHPHELVVSAHSVHTNQWSLEAGERCIEAIGAQLRAQGRI